MKIGMVLLALSLLTLCGCGGGDDRSTPTSGFDSVPVVGDGPFTRVRIAAFFPVTLDITPDLTKETLLDWAQKTFNEHFGGDYLDGSYGPYVYRYYKRTGNYIGFDGNDIYLLGPVSDGELLYVGPILTFKCQVYSCGTYSVKSTGEFVQNGNIQNYLKRLSGTKQMGTEYFAGPNPFTKKGFGAQVSSYPDFSLANSFCEIKFNADGSVSYTTDGQGTVLFSYERLSDSSGNSLLNQTTANGKILRLYSGGSDVKGITISEDRYLDIYMDGLNVSGVTRGTGIKQPDGTPTYMFKTFGITFGDFCSFQVGYWSASSTSLFFSNVISKVGSVSGYVGGKAGAWYDSNTNLPYDCLRASGPPGSGVASCRFEPIPTF